MVYMQRLYLHSKEYVLYLDNLHASLSFFSSKLNKYIYTCMPGRFSSKFNLFSNILTIFPCCCIRTNSGSRLAQNQGPAYFVVVHCYYTTLPYHILYVQNIFTVHPNFVVVPHSIDMHIWGRIAQNVFVPPSQVFQNISWLPPPPISPTPPPLVCLTVSHQINR